jgi:hypothetical protein
MRKILDSKKGKTKPIFIVLVTLAAPLLLILFTSAGCQTTPAEPVKVVTQPVLRCASATEVILFLDRKFNEKPVYTGVFGTSIVLTVFVSAEGSFTIVHTGVQNEISCLVSSGQNFKKLNWKQKKSI